MASVIDPSSPQRRMEPRRTRKGYGRWILIGVVSMLIHLGLLDALPTWTIESNEPEQSEVLRATLMPPIRATEMPVQPSPPPDAPVARPRSAPRKPSPPAFVPESTEAVPQVSVTTPSATGAAPAVVAAEPAPAPAPPAPPVPEPSAPASAATPVVPAIAPQSARLSYTVLSLDTKDAPPTTYYGVGTIDWSVADGRYHSELQASLKILFLKVGLLASHSEGALTPSGLAPDRYTETPRRRATVATNFNRDARQSITYSSSQASVPLMTGAQDRLSVLFQIGALLLADSAQGAAGGRFEIPVAGVRGDVERWIFESQGIESIETGAGSLSTIHLRRAARAGTNDRTIDVWIAQQDGGYPARVLYTEPNGTTIEMTLDGIGAIK